MYNSGSDPGGELRVLEHPPKLPKVYLGGNTQKRAPVAGILATSLMGLSIYLKASRSSGRSRCCADMATGTVRVRAAHALELSLRSERYLSCPSFKKASPPRIDPEDKGDSDIEVLAQGAIW